MAGNDSPKRSILISLRCIILSRFSWFSISSLRALPSFSSVLIPQPILAETATAGETTRCAESSHAEVRRWDGAGRRRGCWLSQLVSNRRRPHRGCAKRGAECEGQKRRKVIKGESEQEGMTAGRQVEVGSPAEALRRRQRYVPIEVGGRQRRRESRDTGGRR